MIHYHRYWFQLQRTTTHFTRVKWWQIAKDYGGQVSNPSSSGETDNTLSTQWFLTRLLKQIMVSLKVTDNSCFVDYENSVTAVIKSLD